MIFILVLGGWLLLNLVFALLMWRKYRSEVKFEKKQIDERKDGERE
jgi:hypothetical protein